MGFLRNQNFTLDKKFVVVFNVDGSVHKHVGLFIYYLFITQFTVEHHLFCYYILFAYICMKKVKQ